MADSQDDKLYKAEYAKSGRASCKKCKENIAKDSLRMAIMVQVRNRVQLSGINTDRITSVVLEMHLVLHLLSWMLGVIDAIAYTRMNVMKWISGPGGV